jgi:hypothetical protein
MNEPAHEHAHDADEDHVDDRVEHEHPRRVAAHETTVAEPGMDWAGMAVRVLLTLVGAAGLIVGAFLDWIRTTSGVNLDITSLWESGFDQESETFVATIGFVAIILGLLAILGLAPRSGWLTRIAGALGIVLFVLFAIQVYRTDLTVQDIEVGAWIALAGGVVALIGGFFGTRQAVVTRTTPAVVEER